VEYPIFKKFDETTWPKFRQEPAAFMQKKSFAAKKVESI
jgi:hypothetical protein